MRGKFFMGEKEWYLREKTKASKKEGLVGKNPEGAANLRSDSGGRHPNYATSPPPPFIYVFRTLYRKS